jgi:hypothetical protein
MGTIAYLILAAILFWTLYKRGVEIVKCIREKNYSGLKATSFLLLCSILVFVGIILVNETWLNGA